TCAMRRRLRFRRFFVPEEYQRGPRAVRAILSPASRTSPNAAFSLVSFLYIDFTTVRSFARHATTVSDAAFERATAFLPGWQTGSCAECDRYGPPAPAPCLQWNRFFCCARR